jgi:hypothetical protein
MRPPGCAGEPAVSAQPAISPLPMARPGMMSATAVAECGQSARIGGRTSVSELSDREVSELATCFPDDVSIRRVLDVAGLPTPRQPLLGAMTSEDVWYGVSRLLANGALRDGRRAVLTAALDVYPDNRVFRAALGKTAPGPLGRERPHRLWDRLPSRPELYEPREELAALRARLCDSPQDGRRMPLVGVVGMAGAGKSTLAREVVHDPRVENVYADGIIWVKAGREHDPAVVAAEVLRELGDTEPVSSLHEIPRRLMSSLAGTRTLLVLDDVWNREILRALAVPSTVGRLVTTRDRGVLFDDVDPLLLGVAEPLLARRLLARYSRYDVDALPASAITVLKECGGLPLALAVAGALVHGGSSWEYVAARLEAADLSELGAEFEDYDYPDLLKALTVSVDMLPADEATRFLELLAFDGRGSVPEDAVLLLWEATSELQGPGTQKLLTKLAHRSLVELDPGTRQVTLHDLMLDYVRAALRAVGRDTAEPHRRLAEKFLARWGGLDAGLPGLWDLAGLDELDRYGVRALIGHLLDGGAPDLAHEVLTAEAPIEARQAEGIWPHTHDGLGRPDGYVADVRAAWRDAKARFAGGDIQVLSWQVVYALQLGSITSLASSVPPKLLVRLVETGLWPVERAVAYARQASDPSARLSGLVGLVPHVRAEGLAALLEDVLAASREVHYPTERVRLLAPLAATVPTDQLPAELAAAVTPVRRRPEGSAHRSTPPTSGNASASAFVSALYGDNPLHGARELVRLAPSLSEGQLRRAFESVAGLGYPWSGREAVDGLAPFLPPDLLPKALEAVLGTDQADNRVHLLTLLAQRVAPDARRPVLMEVLATALKHPFEYSYAESIASIAPHLPKELLEDAFVAATAAEAPGSVARALVVLAPHLPENLVRNAFDIACRIREPDSAALAALAPYLPADLLGPALEAARTVDHPYRACLALAESSTRLPTGEQHAVLLEALRLTYQISDTELKAKALVNVARHVPAEIVRSVMDATFAIVDVYGQAHVMAELLPKMTPRQRSRHLARLLSDLALFGQDPQLTAEALASLAPHARGARRSSVLSWALTEIGCIDDPHDRSEAMGTLAPCLPLSGEQQQLATAAAYIIDDPTLLQPLAKEMPSNLVQRALDALGDRPRLCDEADALFLLAPFLPVEDMDRTLDIARAIALPANRASALAALAAHLPYRLLPRALAVTRSIERPGDRSRVLARLAQREPAAPSRPTLISEALELAAEAGRPAVLDVLTTLLANAADDGLDIEIVTDAIVRAFRWWP